MSRIFRACIIVAGTWLLSGSHALPMSGSYCVAFAKAASIVVKQVHDAGRLPGGPSYSCGHDLQDRFWSPDRKVQLGWCLSVSDETAEKRLREMKAIAGKCAFCRTYSNVLANAAAENIKFGCGFQNGDDQRWKPDEEFHFVGCLQFKDCSTAGPLMIGEAACGGELYYTKPALERIKANVTSSVATCKAEKGATTSSALSTPKQVFEDTPQRPKRAVKRVMAPCAPATAKKGCNAGSVAAAKASGNASRSSPADPIKRSPAVPQGSNTSAMDRLSGDSPPPASSRPGEKGRDGGGGRVPASGGASAVAKPAANTPAPSMRADPTIDMGKCATCGIPPPTPPR